MHLAPRTRESRVRRQARRPIRSLEFVVEKARGLVTFLPSGESRPRMIEHVDPGIRYLLRPLQSAGIYTIVSTIRIIESVTFDESRLIIVLEIKQIRMRYRHVAARLINTAAEGVAAMQ